MRPPTIKAVAAEAGVSVATVSYVLSGRSGGEARVSEPTRLRVLAAVDALGYQPNQQARGIRRGRTDQVCLVLHQLDSPWSKAMADEVSLTMRGIGYSSLILLDGDWSKFLRGRGADGALLDRADAADLPKLKALAQQGIGLVVHSNELEPDGFDVVRSVEEPALAAPDAIQSDPPLTSVGPEAIFPAVAQLLLTRLRDGGPGRLLEAPWTVHRRATC